MSRPVVPSMPQPPTSPLRSVKLWTPTQVLVSTLLLGSAGGITLASLNWARMNLKSKALKYLVATLAWFVASAVLRLFVQPVIVLLFTFLGSLALMFHLEAQMEADLARFTPANTVVQEASWLGALLMGVVGLGSFVLAVTFLILLSSSVLALWAAIPSPAV